ncbi:uncharacterized protein BKA55DRAFT_584421 [Fusarium redolens]|uniref:Uncharacterized protein n=1 Tax=Fusarium redolens TaxID=48865 RepID=A0A9P9FWV8_FUSRE|nr:uncharacterized protein BKA55DRAFT_584421 [Fusarium redolens]KAH7224306.1 hypothetical protein BKA55DRAFT_584421 [Fusarium redolens]
MNFVNGVYQFKAQVFSLGPSLTRVCSLLFTHLHLHHQDETPPNISPVSIPPLTTPPIHPKAHPRPT